MANTKKISELTAITGANVDGAADYIPIVDTTAATTYKITPAELGITPAVGAYRAVIAQAGTSAPNVVYLAQNSLGGTPVWAYVEPGIYTLTMTGLFSATKTRPFFGGYADAEDTLAARILSARYSDVNTVVLVSKDMAGTHANVFGSVYFEIVVDQ